MALASIKRFPTPRPLWKSTMTSNSANPTPDFSLKTTTTVTPIFDASAARVSQLSWWQRGLTFLEQHPWQAVLLSGLSISTLSLATWVGALFLENKVLKYRLAQSASPTAASEESGELKSRITDAQTQLSQLQTQLEQQQTEEMLDNRDALIAENARLFQELSLLSKPQLGTPLVRLNSASVKAAEIAQITGAKPDPFTTVDVPHNLATFTVVLLQTQDKGYQGYLVELTDGKGKNVAWSDQLKGARFPEIPLTFAKRSHAAGKYQLKLYGLNGKKKEFVDHYDLQLNYLPEPTPKKAGNKK